MVGWLDSLSNTAQVKLRTRMTSAFNTAIPLVGGRELAVANIAYGLLSD